MCPNTEFFLVRIFQHNRLEKTPYLDTFHSVYPLISNHVANVNNINNKESDNAFEGSDDTIITNSDVDINDLDKLKTEIMSLKMFVYIY